MVKLIISFNGTEYSDSLERFIAHHNPHGLIIFSKNIESKEKFKTLLKDIKASFPNIVFYIDMEGGLVNRFRKIEGDFPLPRKESQFKEFGKKIGNLLKFYGINVNFAPVVDIDYGIRGNGLDFRYLGKTPEEIIVKAGNFLEGLESEGIKGCLKHYVGLSHAETDSHFGLPFLAEISEMDEKPFKALTDGTRLIMFAHIKIKNYGISTYSPALVNRVKAFHRGEIVCDDLGMKALGEESLSEKLNKVKRAGFDYAIATDMISKDLLVKN